MKSRASDIIKLRADYTAVAHHMSAINMMHPDKPQAMIEVADLQEKLARAYRALLKELAYFLSRPTSPGR